MGERLENDLPGRQGRLLFAFLASQQGRSVTRSDMVKLLWSGAPPRLACGTVASSFVL
jgi:SARP family transcriptional regulator, regulator of embCAB operon